MGAYGDQPVPVPVTHPPSALVHEEQPTVAGRWWNCSCRMRECTAVSHVTVRPKSVTPPAFSRLTAVGRRVGRERKKESKMASLQSSLSSMSYLLNSRAHPSPSLSANSLFPASNGALLLGDLSGLRSKPSVRARSRSSARRIHRGHELLRRSSSVARAILDLERTNVSPQEPKVQFGSARLINGTESNVREFELNQVANLDDIISERGACGVGFIANLQNEASHEIVTDALRALGCMEHRGGCGSDNDSGDGAGVMTSIPWDLFNSWAGKQGISSLDKSNTGVGMVFLPKDEKFLKEAQTGFEPVKYGGFTAILSVKEPTNITL
ncbi:Ferredoxin-dependent glutamate synthase [Asimina triloba]